MDPVHDVAALEAVLAGLAPDDPSRFGVLANLGTALSVRGLRDASPEDLDRSLEAFKQALAAAHNDAERALAHANRSRTLRLRHEFRGAGADLDTAIEEIERSLALTPAGSSAWAGRSTALALGLLARFEERGLGDDLESAVAAARAAADHEGSAPPSRARCVANLAIVLQARYEWLGAPADLDESVDRAAAAAAVPGLPDADRADFLSGLCVSLRIRYRHGRRADRSQDLRDAVAAGRKSAQLGEASPGRQPGRLSNLAVALRLMAADTGDQAAADEAVSALRMALATLNPGHPRRAAYLVNLALCLYDIGDIDEAVDCAREAVSLAAPADARRAWYLVNLGVLQMSRSREVPGNQADVTGAVQAWRAAAADPAASALTRLRAASAWGESLGDLAAGGRGELWQSAAEGFGAFGSVLPRAVWSGLNLNTREDLLTGLAGTPGLAAAALLSAGRGPSSLELSEACRSLLWRQRVIPERELRRLELAAPELAFRLRRVHRELNAGARD